MNMSVYTDSRLFITQSHNEVSSFSPNSRQLKKFIDPVGHFSTIPLNQGAADLTDVLCLGSVKTYRVDGLLDLFGGNLEHLFRGLCEPKEATGCLSRGLILRAQAENARYEDLKWVPRRGCHYPNNGSLPFGHLMAQDANRFMDVALFHLS